MTYLNTTPSAKPAVMAFFLVSTNQSIANGALVGWTKTGGSSLITVSSGTVTLPGGYVWAITTQILLPQDATRQFILWDGSAEYTGSQRLEITTTDTGLRMSHNLLSTETGPKTIAWQNTQTTQAIDALDAGMQIIGVAK